MRRALLLVAALPACQVPDVTFSVAPADCVVSPAFPIQTADQKPAAVAVGDLDGDGRPDIVVAERTSDTLSVLIGSATAVHAGEYELRVEYLTGAQPSAVALADVNGDGKLDAVVGNAGDGTIGVLLGTGDPAVSFHPQRSVPVGGAAVAVVAADLDGDRAIDLGVLLASGDVAVLLGNGDGTFRAAVSYPAGEGGRQIVSADVDGDRAQDLVILRTPVSDDASLATLLVGNGDGTFRTAVDRALGATATALAAADVSGDGVVDLVVARRGFAFPGTVSILLGSGDGQFTDGADVATDAGPIDVALADINRDGKLDLVVDAQRTSRDKATGGAFDVFFGNGDGSFGDKIDAFGSMDPLTMAVADLNGDHIPDIVALSGSDATVGTASYAGDGTVSARADYRLGTGPSSIAFGDVTDDGATDAVIADRKTMGLAVDVISPDGFVARVEVPTQGAPVAPLIADLDGDFHPDIVAANLDHSSVTVALRNARLGASISLFNRSFDLATAAGPAAVAATDLDRDGKLDLVVAARDAGAVSVLLNRGGGSFAPHVDYPAGEQPSAVAAVDLAGGARAVVVANRVASTISVLVANPDGTLRDKVDYPTGAQPVALAAGDVTGDGIADVVVADYAGRGVTVFAGNGDGTFHSLGELATGAGPVSVVIVHFPGEAVPAIAVANANSRSLSVVRSDGKGGFLPAVNHAQVDRPLTVAADPAAPGEVGLFLDEVAQNQKTAVLGVCLE